MLIVAWALSLLSVLLTAMAIDSWRLHVLPWGFEGTGYVAFFSFTLATLAAISALAIGIMRARSGQERASPVVLLSAVSLLALIALVVACPAGC